MKIVKLATLACLISILGTGSVLADACSGRDHTTGTVLGAVGGAAIGGVASNNAGGAVVGAVVGGLAGNAIARSQDCDGQNYRARDHYNVNDSGNRYNSNRDGYNGNRGGYTQRNSYYGTPDENDYWNEESYDDFNNDYRHIWAQIRRGRENGSLTRYSADRYSQKLQRIHQRADWQQRAGRFDPQEAEGQLQELRRTIRFASQNNDYGR
jgi:hypothetical protein